MNKRVILMSLLFVSGLMVGCGRQKAVRITAEPAGATVYLTKKSDGQEGRKVKIGSAPMSTKLDFGKEGQQIEYLIELAKASFSSHTETIAFGTGGGDQYQINVKLKKIYTDIEMIRFDPIRLEEGSRLTMKKVSARAYIDTSEPSPNARHMTQVTEKTDPDHFLQGPTMSPVEDVFVIPIVEVHRNPEARSYRVKHGESLEELADRFGVSVKELTEVNKLEKDLFPNQRLFIPDDEYVSHLWRHPIYPAPGTQITSGEYLDVDAIFSPDGEFIYFRSPRFADNPTLWRTRVDGSGGITKITQSPATDYSPSVSGSGEFVVYASLPPRSTTPEIWKCKVDGTLATQLCEGQSPRISPDVLQIAFVRDDARAGVKRIYVMNSNATGETQLTHNEDYDTIDPAWSPDGEWFAFASDHGKDSEGNKNFDIWVMRGDGTQMIQLTTNGSWDDKPSWDQSGTQIYFRSNRGGSWQIWRFTPILPELSE